MKKYLGLTIVLFVLMALSACRGEGDTPEFPLSTQYDNDQTDDISTETPTTDLPDEELIIQISIASDEILSTFTTLHHVHMNESGIDLVIWANQPLQYVSLISLEPEWLEDRDEWGFSPRDNFGYIELLLPGEGYVVNNYMGLGTLPHVGIGFFDETIQDTRVFFFQENHAYPEHGDAWIIHEIETDRLIWGVASGGVDPHDEDGYSIIINGVRFANEANNNANVVYTIADEQNPTHVMFSVIWSLGLDAISTGSQSELQYNGSPIGVALNTINYLVFDSDRVAIGIDDTFMADDGHFTVYIPISLISTLGFDVSFAGDQVHINGEFNATVNPHPLAIALQNFILNAEGETQAHIPNIDGYLSVLAIEIVDGFAEATLFVYTGHEVISKDIGSIEGFPFSVGFAADGWGSLVKMTGDGGNRSYTMFAVSTNPTTSQDEIIYLFTIYAIRADDGSINYSRYDGGWQDGIEGGSYPITEDDFYAIRSSMGDSIASWRDTSDSSDFILSWVASIW